MAQQIVSDRWVVNHTSRAWGVILIVGALAGLAHWLLSQVLARSVIEPFACTGVVNAGLCSEAIVSAGGIATVLIAVAALIVLVRLSIFRPLLITIAAAVALWSLAQWVSGLWWVEAVAWSIVLYILAYALFGWIARHMHIVVALIVSVLSLVVLQLSMTLF